MFIKKSYLLILTIFALTITSCGDDDTNNPGLQSVDPDPTEDVELNPATVSDNITIENGTIETGTPPVPVGNLPFSLDYTTQSGFLTNGFNITYEYNSSYTGAYIQIVSNDGTPAPNYWDVSIASPFKSPSTISNRKKTFNQKKNKNYEQEIDVNFEDIIPPGKFCYIICVYDANGNISQPQEVCVVIEAWGGNPNLVGTWNLAKEEIMYEGNTNTYLTGEEHICEEFYSSTYTCNNQSTIDIVNYYCRTTNLYSLTFNTNGTFSGIYNFSLGKRISLEQTLEACQISYTNDIEYNSNFSGYWAYNEEKAKLTFVYFNEMENGIEIYTPDDGRAYSVDLSEVSASTLILNDPGEEAIKEYFSKQ